MNSLIDTLNSLIWSPPLVYLCLGAGLYFSLRGRFLQVRHISHMIRVLRRSHSSAAGVSSFQAMTISLSGRVGTGNIAGVASAIAVGGPGAVFWMWTVAFLGASTAFVESTLGQIYKERDERGQYRGGPAYFIEKGMGQGWYAWLFAVATILAMGFFMPGIQANSIAAGMENAWGLSPVISSSFVVAVLGLIIFGGIRRIAKFAEVVVPFMAIAYILVATSVLVVYADQVPAAFALIFDSAFGFDAGFGAIVGTAIQQGVKRGVYSNEAGQGTGPHAASAAEVSHPAQQGLVAAFSVYIDTLFICTATALIILVTGMYNVGDGAGGFLHQGLPGMAAGPGYVQSAFETVLPGLGSSLTALALLFFAFTTIVAYYYIAETNVTFINRRVHRPWLVMLLKVMMMVAVFYGGVKSTGEAWALGDIGLGLMAWLNIVAILIMQKPAFAALKDYEKQLDAGVKPQFDPKAVGVQRASFWEQRAAGNDSAGSS